MRKREDRGKFLKPPSDISNSNEKRMVEEKGDAW